MSYERLLDPLADRLGVVHDPAAGVAGLVGLDVEVHGVEHPELELGREVQDLAEQRAERQHVGGDREVGDAEGLGQPPAP